MNIAILGGGAVGLALAASLAESGRHGICLFLRSSAIPSVEEQGIGVDLPDGREVRIAPGVVFPVDASADDPVDLDYDILFIATKAYQVATSLAHLFARARAGSRPRAVVLLQNGWGSAEEARAVVPPEVAVCLGVVISGLTRLDNRRVRINGVSAPLTMGSLSGAAQDLLATLVEQSGNGFLPLALSEDIRATALQKLLLNTTLNATCTLTGLTYGELVTLEEVRPLALSVASEALDVLDEAFGFKRFACAVSFLDGYLRPLIVPRTASHRPSMAQDVEEGRETEIDYLNGAIVRLAERHDLAVPVNRSLVAMIKARSPRRGVDRPGVET